MDRAGQDNPLRRRHLRPDLAVYWSCFLDCNKTRRSGFDGPERITPGEVRDWFLTSGYTDPELIADGWKIIGRLDDERATLIQELREQEDEDKDAIAKAKERKNADA